MKDNYRKIATQNLARLYSNLPRDLEANLPGKKQGNKFRFRAFGRSCIISPKGIILDGEQMSSVIEILISLYALNATPEICISTTFKSFKEMPGTAPYVGAFITHTQDILVDHVDTIKTNRRTIAETLGGRECNQEMGGDFSLVVYPLPKIALCYIFYGADTDFPASVTCLFSANAERFLPMDGLADAGEYTSRTILEIINWSAARHHPEISPT